MRYALLLLATLVFVGCAQQQTMQQRIDHLETRIAELESAPNVWPTRSNSMAQQGIEVHHPWWNPAPIHKQFTNGFGILYDRWEFPGFELNLSDELTKRLALGPDYNGGESPSTHNALSTPWMLPNAPVLYQDASFTNSYPVSNQWRAVTPHHSTSAVSNLLDDYKPDLNMGTFRLPEEQ